MTNPSIRVLESAGSDGFFAYISSISRPFFVRSDEMRKSIGPMGFGSFHRTALLKIVKLNEKNLADEKCKLQLNLASDPWTFFKSGPSYWTAFLITV